MLGTKYNSYRIADGLNHRTAMSQNVSIQLMMITLLNDREYMLYYAIFTLDFKDANKYFTSFISASNEAGSASISLDSKSITTTEWSGLTRIFLHWTSP